MGLLNLANITSMFLLTLTPAGFGQSQNTTTQPRDSNSRFLTLRLGEDQIGTIKTAAKLSTRISFREPVKEIVCGDLYDPTSGTGSFVVQRIENDVFVKPVASKGESNLFVKAGERGEHTYNFSLVIVSLEQAYTVVKVTFGSDAASTGRVANPRRALTLPATLPISSADFFLADANNKTGAGPFGFLNAPVFREPPPPPAAAVPVKVGGRIPINRVTPQYPEYAKRMNLVGDVVLEVTIDFKGKVKSVRVISGSPVFQHSAVSAARQWRFTPGSSNERKAQTAFLITFRFRGTDDGTDAVLSSSSRR